MHRGHAIQSLQGNGGEIGAQRHADAETTYIILLQPRSQPTMTLYVWEGSPIVTKSGDVLGSPMFLAGREALRPSGVSHEEI